MFSLWHWILTFSDYQVFKLKKKISFCLNLSWMVLGKRCDSCLTSCWLVLSPPFGKTLIPVACFHGCIFPALWHAAVAGNQSSFLKERRDWVRRALNTNNIQHWLVQEIGWIKWRNICKREAFPLWVYHNKACYSGTCLKGPERSEKERKKNSSLWREKRKEVSAVLCLRLLRLRI